MSRTLDRRTFSISNHMIRQGRERTNNQEYHDSRQRLVVILKIAAPKMQISVRYRYSRYLKECNWPLASASISRNTSNWNEKSLHPARTNQTVQWQPGYDLVWSHIERQKRTWRRTRTALAPKTTALRPRVLINSRRRGVLWEVIRQVIDMSHSSAVLIETIKQKRVASCTRSLIVRYMSEWTDSKMSRHTVKAG